MLAALSSPSPRLVDELTHLSNQRTTGGAILVEDSTESLIDACIFRTNGAFGLSRATSYASAGSGGALYIKFSSMTVQRSLFESNWVTAGGIQYSIGMSPLRP
jgi:PBP1b-binding outer membrane lipoprotein LpoB